MADLAARGDAVGDGLLREAESEVTPADPMVMVYSSGSTSDPKGAIHSQGACVRHAHNLWQLRDIESDDVLYTPMPLFWVGGFSFTLIAAMHAGAKIVFEEQFEPGATLELIERERVTQVMGWPHMAKALVDHPSFAQRDLSAVRGGSMSALAAPAPPGRGRGAQGQLARHDRDARPPHVRQQGQRPAARQGGILRPLGARGGAQGRRPHHRSRTCRSARSASCGCAATR